MRYALGAFGATLIYYLWQVQEIKLECLDITADLLKRFGHDLEADHERVMKTVLAQVGSATHWSYNTLCTLLER